MVPRDVPNAKPELKADSSGIIAPLAQVAGARKRTGQDETTLVPFDGPCVLSGPDAYEPPTMIASETLSSGAARPVGRLLRLGRE